MIDLLSDETRRDPYPAYAQLRARSPVAHLPGPDLWMLLDYDDVRRALTDHDAFSSNVAPSRSGSFEWLLFMDPPRHTQLRAVIQRAFTPRSVQSLEPRIRELSGELLQPLLDRERIDLVADFAAPLPMMVIADMIGVSIADWEQLKQWAEAIVNLGSTILGTPAESQAASASFQVAHAEMTDYFARALAARRTAPREDLLTRLASADVDGARLGEGEIVRFIQLLLAAGTETTTNLIDNAMLSFIDHPRELERLRAAPELLPPAIEEVLRHRSPVQAMFRATRRDVEVRGHVIPAGKMVLTMLGAANRDPRRFADAERFDVARDASAHLAFGHGIHFCLGAPLSRLEARIALSDLLARFRSFQLAGDQPWPPRKAFHVHGPERLPLRVSPD